MNPDVIPWIILFLPLLAAVVITLFTQHDRKLSAGLSIGAVVAGFVLSLIFIKLNGWGPARESSVSWLVIGSGTMVISRCSWRPLSIVATRAPVTVRRTGVLWD